jgi:hypothetical protein
MPTSPVGMRRTARTGLTQNTGKNESHEEI